MLTLLLVILLVMMILQPISFTPSQNQVLRYVIVILVVLWALGFFGGYYSPALFRVCR